MAGRIDFRDERLRHCADIVLDATQERRFAGVRWCAENAREPWGLHAAWTVGGPAVLKRHVFRFASAADCALFALVHEASRVLAPGWPDTAPGSKLPASG